MAMAALVRLPWFSLMSIEKNIVKTSAEQAVSMGFKEKPYRPWPKPDPVFPRKDPLREYRMDFQLVKKYIVLIKMGVVC
jgi:hypothetical protein